jgi:hypothetical protein
VRRIQTRALIKCASVPTRKLSVRPWKRQLILGVSAPCDQKGAQGAVQRCALDLLWIGLQRCRVLGIEEPQRDGIFQNQGGIQDLVRRAPQGDTARGLTRLVVSHAVQGPRQACCSVGRTSISLTAMWRGRVTM